MEEKPKKLKNLEDDSSCCNTKREGCPHCGRCPKCGRKSPPYEPWHPYPYMPNHWYSYELFWRDCNTWVSSNDSSFVEIKFNGS